MHNDVFFSLINLCTTSFFFFLSCRIYFVCARGQSLSCIYRIILLFTLFLLEKGRKLLDLSYRFDCLSLQFSMFAPEIVYMLLIKLH